MANVANKGTFAAYNGASLNELFYEPVFRSDDIMRNYRVIPNVKHKMNVYTSAALTKIVAPYTGCSSSSGSTQFDIDNKTITAGRCRVALEQCTDEFFGTYIEEMYRNGVDVMNLEGTELSDAIVNRAVKGIGQDVVRLSWGGDSTTANYTAFDGWMKIMGADATVLGARTEVSAVAPTTPTAAESLSLIRQMYDNAPAALQQVPAADKKIFVSPKTYNAYLQNLEGTSADLAITNQQDGMLVVKFRGVELVPMYEWDVALTALTGADLPALFTCATAGIQATQGCIYAAKDNLIIGSNVTDPDTQLKMFYDEVSDNMYIRSNFTMGYQYGWDSLVNGGCLV